MKLSVLLVVWMTLLASQQAPCEQAKPARREQDASRRAKLTDADIRSEERLYRKTPEGELHLHVYFPPGWKRGDARPAIVLFFGGAWKTGSYRQFVPQAEYFASRGMLAASADYRIKNKHGTTPDKSVEDAKGAMRWMRSHASELGVDANKIVAGGGSAGGHLAAATALVDGFDAAGDEASVSCRPCALVLFNPVFDLTRTTSDTKNTGTVEMRKRLSPIFGLQHDAPPAILFYGSGDDKYFPQGEEYAAKAKELGVRAELYVAPGQSHGFFNKSPWTEATVRKADEFLESLRYLQGEPTVKLPADAPKLDAR
jgi:acetyl esterase/lipase